MSTADDLTTLGWRTDTPARLDQAVLDFQSGWNLGPALAKDGNAGPATRAALAKSMSRHAAGLPDYSEHFDAAEFACACDGRNADCRRIWSPRSTVRLAEKYRAIVGPFTPDRACRCPAENARVGGAARSQHLYGKALDVPIYKVTPQQLRDARIGANGIGTYTYRGTRYVRHIDNRSKAVNPWSYGTTTTPPLTPHPNATEETTDMTLSKDDAQTIWSSDLIDSPDLDPDNPTWSPESYLRWTFRLTRETAARVAGLEATVSAIATKGLYLTPEQITEAARAGAALAIEETVDAARVELVVEQDATPEEADQ